MSRHTDTPGEDIKAELAERDKLAKTLMDTRDSLDRENYRLDTLEMTFEHVQEEINRLESLTLSGILSSILGTKDAKLDELRDQCDNLEVEHRHCDETVAVLKQRLAELTSQLSGFAEAEEFKGYRTNDPVRHRGRSHQLEQAIEAGTSLITLLSGAYGICKRLPSNLNTPCENGASFATIAPLNAKPADSVAEQIAASVQGFCAELGKLGLDPENRSDAEMLSEWNQIVRFGDPASLGASATANDWAELETLAACLVTDLQERLFGRTLILGH